MNNFRPISMKCTYEEYLSIKDFIVKNVDKIPVENIGRWGWLSNYYDMEKNNIGFVANPHTNNREVYAKFCAKTFLNACGFDVEQNLQLEWQVKDHEVPLTIKERQEALIRTNPDVADIYWELEELKSKYADAKEKLLQIRFNDEVYKLTEHIEILNKVNDNLHQQIKDLKKQTNKKETPIETKFEVIDHYPNSPFKIGDTLEKYFNGWGTGEPQTYVRYPHFFPNLFRQIN